MIQKLLFSVLLVGVAPPVFANFISGYAVSYHHDCRSTNLPATVVEMEKFFASEYFPEDATKNFLWLNSAVKQVDWHRSSDFFTSDQTASGNDGADSGLVAYIASHGVTRDDVYSASMGSPNNGGCQIRSSSMQLGNDEARYLVLSTCQGLKIGTGSNPTRPGADPKRTWEGAVEGLNCIYGYSNNMIDASDYGDYFLKNLATTDMTLADAFFSASRSVSTYNIPAVMCYGLDEENARFHLENDKRFTFERNGGNAAAWAYQNFRKVKSEPVGEKRVPDRLKLAARSVDLSALARNLLGYRVNEPSSYKNVTIYHSDKGSVTSNRANSSIRFIANRGKTTLKPALKDQHAIAVARTFLVDRLQIAAPGKMRLAGIVDKGVSSAGASVVTEKIVIFREQVAGLSSLGQLGSAEVTVNNAGKVVALLFALVDTENVASTQLTELNQTLVDDARLTALDRLKAKYPQAKLTIVDTEVGYDFGSEHDPLAEGHASVQVLIEVAQGDYARTFQELIRL